MSPTCNDKIEWAKRFTSGDGTLWIVMLRSDWCGMGVVAETLGVFGSQAEAEKSAEKNAAANCDGQYGRLFVRVETMQRPKSLTTYLSQGANLGVTNGGISYVALNGVTVAAASDMEWLRTDGHRLPRQLTQDEDSYIDRVCDCGSHNS